VDSRGHRNQILEASSIQGNVFDEFPVDNSADRRIPSVEGCSARFDCHGFGNGPNRESEVQGNRALHVQDDVRFDDCLEALFGYLYAVLAWRKDRDSVDSSPVRLA